MKKDDSLLHQINIKVPNLMETRDWIFRHLTLKKGPTIFVTDYYIINVTPLPRKWNVKQTQKKQNNVFLLEAEEN